MQGNFELPWGMHASSVFRWLEGRPFSRRARVSLEQGLTDVILEPANDSRRLPDQTFFDISLGKTFSLGSGTSLTLDAQVFNILNEKTFDYLESTAYARGQIVPSDYILPAASC